MYISYFVGLEEPDSLTNLNMFLVTWSNLHYCKNHEISGLLGQFCLVRFAGSGLLGKVCWVRFAGSGFPGQVCWVRVTRSGLLG